MTGAPDGFYASLPVFRDFDVDKLPETAQGCAVVLQMADGLDRELELVRQAKLWIMNKVTEIPAFQKYLDNWGDWDPWPA